MLMKALFPLILGLLMTSSIIAQTPILASFDSQNKVYSLHQVIKKQSIYAICKYYQITEQELLTANPDLNRNSLPESIWLKIPLSNSIQFNITALSTNSIPIFYKMQKGETVYGLAKNKLKIHPSQLQSLNNINLNNIHQDQMVQIGWLNTTKTATATMPPIENETPNDTISTQLEDKGTIPAEATGKAIDLTKTSRGVAWCPEVDLGESGYFALHAKAKRNSLIEITNPILGRTVMAKVIGRIPKNIPKDVQVLVSKDVANVLLANNSRFFVQIRYGLK